MSEKTRLILIDDEERILRSLSMLFRGPYEVLATTDPQQVLDWVSQQTVHVIVSDQRMPVMRGAELLRRVREKSPNTMRLLLTGYSELEAVVASVNEGEIFRFINKPWDAQELRSTVDQAAQIARSLFAGPAAAPVSASSGSLESVLILDDDADVYTIVRETLPPEHAVHWARNLDEAFALIERYDPALLISELAVAGDSITPFLKLLKAQHPEIVSIVLTPFQDVGVFVGLINQGQVYRLLPKPARRGPLGMSIASALRHHRAMKLMPQLRAAHTVERLPAIEAEEPRVATRVLGFLGRLRTRALAG